MKQLLTLLIFILLLPTENAVAAGKLKAEDIAKIKARSMIMVLREADPDAVKRYEKNPRTLAAYKKEIATYNERIQKVAPRIWKFNSEVLFKPESEVTALQKSKNKEYAIATFDLQKVKEKSTLSSTKDPFKDEMVVPGITIHLIEKPSAALGTYQFMHRTPSEAELAVGLMQLQAEYSGIEGGNLADELQQPNTETLKTKILVLDQAQFKIWISDADIKKIYPYPYVKADKATIDKLILEQNPEYAILSIAPIVGQPRLMHSIVDLETGSTLSSVVPGAEGTGINYRDSTVITKESIIGYANGVGQ